MSFFQSFAIFNYTFPPYYLCNFLLSEVSLLLFSIAQHDKLPIKLYLFSPEMCSNTESWHYHMLCTLFPYSSFKCVTLFPCFLFVITQINHFIGYKLWKQLETHYIVSPRANTYLSYCYVYIFLIIYGKKNNYDSFSFREAKAFVLIIWAG